MDPSNALLAVAGTNVLVALSLAFPLSCGVISLASAGFVGIGASTTLLLVSGGGWSWTVAEPVGGLAALVVAIPLSVLAARLPPSLASVATLAFTVGTAALLGGQPSTGTFDRAPIPDAVPWWLLMTSLLTATYLLLQTRRSRFGQALFTIRADPALAASLGINVSLHRGLAFLLSAGIAGAAGAVAALLGVAGGASVDWPVSVAGLEAVVIGGVAASWGPWLGALALSFLPFVVQLGVGWAAIGQTNQVGETGPLAQVAFGVITLLVLLVAPGGMSGSLRRWRERRRTVALSRPDVAPRATVPALAVVTAAAAQTEETEPMERDVGATSPADRDGGAEANLADEPPFRAAAS